FSEELGAVIQIRTAELDQVSGVLRSHGLKTCVTRIGKLNTCHALRINRGGREIYNENLVTLRDIWSDVTRRIAGLRDNPACAEQEHALRLNRADPGLTPKVTFGFGEIATEGTNDAKSEKTTFEPSAPFVANSAV